MFIKPRDRKNILINNGGLFHTGDVILYKNKACVVDWSDGYLCKAIHTKLDKNLNEIEEVYYVLFLEDKFSFIGRNVFHDYVVYKEDTTSYIDEYGNVFEVKKSEEDKDDKVIALLYAIAKSKGYTATDIYRAAYPEKFAEERKQERIERRKRKLEQKKNKEIIDFAKTFVYPMNRERTRMIYKSLKAKGIDPYYIEDNCIVKANMNTCYKYGKDTVFHKNGYIQPIQQLKEYFSK